MIESLIAIAILAPLLVIAYFILDTTRKARLWRTINTHDTVPIPEA